MEKLIRLKDTRQAATLFGRHDENIKLIEKEFSVRITMQGDTLKIDGIQEAIEKAIHLINKLLGVINTEGAIKKQDIACSLRALKHKTPAALEVLNFAKVEVSLKGKPIGPKTKGQDEYVQAIHDYDIVFGLGPAGTGKTYLAMASAVAALKKGDVRRIILTRPAIEAGESLGFLPGDMYEKISPYLRPLYDALYDMMDAERIEKYIEMGIIEVAPLAYMRGRTLNDAFIILDEAQNCTTEQMKMFLTRLGFDSKTVITGDPTQSDLSDARPSGLLEAQELLKPIEGIKFIYFTGQDVVRHELVQRIIEAYEKSADK